MKISINNLLLKEPVLKNKEKAIDTLKIIKDRDIIYQKQVVNTMYNRAKYHPHQTENMREAMKVFEKWLQKNIKK